jgi:hypothetical protein
MDVTVPDDILYCITNIAPAGGATYKINLDWLIEYVPNAATRPLVSVAMPTAALDALPAI